MDIITAPLLYARFEPLYAVISPPIGAVMTCSLIYSSLPEPDEKIVPALSLLIVAEALVPCVSEPEFCMVSTTRKVLSPEAESIDETVAETCPAEVETVAVCPTLISLAYSELNCTANCIWLSFTIRPMVWPALTFCPTANVLDAINLPLNGAVALLCVYWLCAEAMRLCACVIAACALVSSL